MMSRITSALFVLILLSYPIFFGGCAGTTGTDTLATDDLYEGLKELYDAEAVLNKADSLFQDKDYIGAIQEYRRFLELHPIHKSAPYAQYSIGLSYFEQIRTIDRDIEPAQKALSAFENQLTAYPGNDYADDVREKIKICRGKLAAREFYVGDFYLRQEEYPAAIERFNNILSDYRDTEVLEKTIYHLGIAYRYSGEPSMAIEALQNLLIKYPDSRYKEDASELLATLNRD